MPNPPVYSHSALNTFNTCPKQYKHLYFLRDVKHQKTLENERGERVHKTIATWIEQGTEAPGCERELLIAQQMVKTIRAKAKPGYSEYAEMKWGVTRDFSPTGFFDGDVFMRGVVDYLLVDEAVALLIDWKTGKRKDDFSQLDTFAMAAFSLRSGVERVRAAFLWLNDPAPVALKDYTRSDLPRLINGIESQVQTVAEHIDHDNFPGRPSGLCRGWCPVKKCEHWRDRG